MEITLIAWAQFDAKWPTNFFFVDGELFEGTGPYQFAHKLDFNTTLGAIRNQTGDASIGKGLHDNTKACVFGLPNGNQEEEDYAEIIFVKVNVAT